MRNHISIIFTALVLFATAALAQVAEPTAVAVPETTDALGDTIAVDPSPLYAEAEFDDIVELDGITIDPRERPMEPMAPEGLEIGKAGEYSYFSSDAVGIGTGAVEPGVQLEIYSPTGTGTVDMLRLRSKHDTGPNVYSLYFSPREVSYVIENGATGTNLTLSTKAVSGGSFQAGYGNILLMPHGNVGVANASPAYPLDVTGTARVTGFIMPTGASANRVLTSNASGVGTWEELPSMPADNVTGSGTANYVAKFTSTGSVIGNSSIYDNGTNVGIGTASPAEKLHVIGNIQSSNGALIGTQFISNSIYSAADGILITTDIAISNNRMIELYIEGNSYDSWGAIGGKVQAYNYVTSGTIISTSYVTHGISPSEVRIFHHDGVVKFWMEQTRTYQTYRFRLSTHSGSHKITSIQNTAMPSTGVTNEVVLTPKTVINNNVGIGLSNPSRPLDVNGAGRIRGDLGVDNNLGVTGQTSTGTFLMTTGASTGHVLTSDASGYGTWQALPTLPSDNVTGTGTANYVAKFTSTGSVIGNSSIFDDGTNVGIGTASPLEKIHINGDVLMKSNTGTRTLTITMEAVTAGNVNLDLKPNSTSDQLAHIKSTYGFQFETNTSGTAVDALRITPAGNVGIGTPSPVDKLDVYGGGITVSDGTDAGFIDFRHDRDDSRIYESSYNLHMISANGLTFDYDANGNDGGDFIINDNGTARFFVERVTGDIGIHTTAPTTDLDVNGTTRLRGHLYDYGNSSGSSGQILTRGASGVLWSDGDGDFIQNQSSSDQDAWFQIDKTLPNDGDAVAEINFAKASVTTNTAYGVKITSDALDGKGVMCGLSASTEINPVSHSQDGKASAILANVRGYDLRGEIIGVWGISNPTRLSQIGGTSWANGVKGVVSPDGGTLTLDSGDETWVAGAYGEIKGTINNTPGAGAVAGIIGIDNAIGTATSYAGYFDGDVHITGNLTGGGLSSSNWTLSGTDLYPSSTTYDVGIGTTSPGYKLDVNGVIRNNNNIYFGSNTPGGSDELSTDFNDGIIVYTPVSGDRLVSIEVDNDDILTATQSGNVGVGTTSPDAKLHSVSSYSGTGSALTNASIAGVNDNDDSDNPDGIGVYGECSTDYGYAGYFNGDLRVTGKYLDSSGDAGISGQILSSTGSGTNWIAAPSGGSLPSGSSGQTLRHNGTSWIANSTLYNNGTNVGIGTTGPSTNFEVYESSTSTTPMIEVQQASTGDAAMRFIAGNTYTIGVDNSDGDKFKISDYTLLSSNTRLTIDASGNVGIGTTSPASELSVGGSGNALYEVYSYQPTTTTSGAAAIYGDCALPAVNSAGHYAYGVYGHSESDNGHAVGVCGAATGGDALGGRGIGVRGTASGSTNGYNHGVYGYLSSGVGGSAVVGYDYNGCTSWSGGVSTAYDYAGYFVGQVNIYQSRSATSQLTGLNVTLSNSSSSADAMYGVDISSSKSYDSGSNYGLDVYVNNGRFVYGVNSNANGGSSYTYGVYGRGSTYGVYASGSLGASGTKSAIVRTEEGPKAVYCQESPENWFEDFGKAKIAGGKAVVGVAKDFLMTVTINDEYPMNVFITPNARLGEWWVEEKHDEFVLHAPDAPDGAGFSYRIVAKRKGYEDIRLLDAPSSWIDHFLYPNIEDVPQEYREEWINVEPTQNWDQWLEYLSENQKAHYQNYKEDEKREELSRKEFEAENSAKSE